MQRVAPGLLSQPGGGVDDDEGQICGGRSRGHVARVLDVPGAIRNDELAAGCRRIAVGDVDGDALLALGSQAVGDEGQVHAIDPASPARRSNGFELVVEELLGIAQEAADERRFSVVDRPDRGEAQQIRARRRLGAGVLGHLRSSPLACGPPSKSPRTCRQLVWRLSLTREEPTSVITSSMVSACERTAPVQVASPTVRNRTVVSSTTSPGVGTTHSETASSMPSRSTTGRRWAK